MNVQSRVGKNTITFILFTIFTLFLMSIFREYKKYSTQYNIEIGDSQSFYHTNHHSPLKEKYWIMISSNKKIN